MVTPGYGKASQDWSYLTPKRAIWVQSGNVTDPANIDDAYVIDTTVKANGSPTDRGRNQTLVLYAIPKSGATLNHTTAVLYLWISADWDTKACDSTESSSQAICPDVEQPSDLDDSDRWALIAASTHADSAITNGAMAFSFPWLPAGKYKAAMGAGVTGDVIIAEQHTE